MKDYEAEAKAAEARDAAIKFSGVGHVLLADGRRVYVKAGDRLFVKVDPKTGAAVHAWAEDDGRAEERRKTSVTDELIARVMPAFRRFVAEMYERLPRFDDGNASTFEVRVGVVEYDDEDRPLFDGVVKTSHEETM